MRQLGVDTITDNLVEKLVEASAKLYRAAAKHGEKNNIQRISKMPLLRNRIVNASPPNSGLDYNQNVMRQLLDLIGKYGTTRKWLDKTR